MADHPHYGLLIQHGLAEDKLREAVQNDPAVRADAEAELASVEPIEQRCVISREYAETLRRVLA